MNRRRLPAKLLLWLTLVAWGKDVGAGAPGPATPPEETLTLEPLRVDETTWQRIAIPHYYVIAESDSDTVEYFVHGLIFGAQVQEAMLPRRYLLPWATRKVVILYDRSPGRTLHPTPPAATLQTSPAPGLAGTKQLTSPGGTVREDDSLYECVNLHGIDSSGSLCDALPSFKFRLLHRTPAMPEWLIAGLIGPDGIYSGGVNAREHWQNRSVIFVPPVPAPPKGFSQGRWPLNLAGLFAQLAADRSLSPEEWNFEAALFVRWGIYGEASHPAHQAAFFKFLDRTITATRPTDADARATFGYGFAEIDARLREYLPAATQRYTEVLVESATGSDPSAHAATKLEVATALGDWERAKGQSLAQTDPSRAKVYWDAAQKIFSDQTLQGETDPSLQEAMGLWSYATGDAARAKQLLEKSNQGKLMRPSACLALAKLRWAAVTQGLSSRSLPLGPSQIKEVLTAIGGARAQQPAIPGTYLLLADIWASSGLTPNQSDFDALKEGMVLFPRDSSIAEAVGRVTARWGHTVANAQE